VLVAGVSTRALAESAARAGFAVTSIDAFADVDQHPAVDVRSLGTSFSPAAAAAASRPIACDAVVYGASFENHPSAVDSLAHGRALWGNTPDVLRRVRDPMLLSEALRRRGFEAPAVIDTRTPNPEPRTPNPEPDRWLVKRRASGGGHGVSRWRHGDEVPADAYLQEFIEGVPTSVLFVAASGRAAPIGVSLQLIGDAAFGVSGFRWCGNILTGSCRDVDEVNGVAQVAAAICDEFALVGVNGIDLIARDGVPYAVEVNPRWCASMELVERAYGVSVFGMHAAACRDGALPAFDLANARRGAPAVGKAIVFARHDVDVGNTRPWLVNRDPPAGDLRDIPHAGTRIRAGRPICSVFATARDAAACRAELVRKAEQVYASVNAML
jgi:predicted ATP-grasp superfamily ATP-dependent carboligase